jgi:hypothetical protein
VGQGCRYRLRHQNHAPCGDDAGHSGVGIAALGQASALGVAPRWPARDALAGAGQALAEQYRKEGLELLHQHAQFAPTGIDKVGSVSVEAGLMDMLIRMESGRFKVFDHLNDWWEEFRLYRPEGLSTPVQPVFQVVALGDQHDTL